MEKKPIIQALTGISTPRVPFWLMRQAGRYLPEYRALREKAGSFLNLCFTPEFAVRVTMQPIERFDMDAAILFSDILVVPYALGQKLDFVEGEGPRLDTYKKLGDIDFSTFDQKLGAVYETIRGVRKTLADEKALIGFAGAPWTLACYMIQGHGDGEFTAAKKFAFEKPEEMDALIAKLADATAHYLIEQIKAGVDAVQIFDSWAGLLPEPYFGRWVIQPTQDIVKKIHAAHPGFPIIGFPRRAGVFYQDYAEQSGVSCVGLDQYHILDQAICAFGKKVSLQGNLDPVYLLAGGKTLEGEVKRILAAAGKTPFIFNLGHGVIKETLPEHVAQLAQILKSHERV